MFGHFFDRGDDSSALQSAILRAVDNVEPLIKHTRGYQANYRAPVETALEYAHSLAERVPGPVAIDRAAYAANPFVHALFPSADSVAEAFSSSRAMLEYHDKFPDSEVMYALMGMRRLEKNAPGMELAGDVIQRDVMQKTIYFTGHTLDSPAPTEAQSREQVALSFFDSLVGKVKLRIEARKQSIQSQLQQKNQLAIWLREADEKSRPALQAELSCMLANMQSSAFSAECYVEDFEAVLLHPEQHLKLRKTPIAMDGMGIRRSSDDPNQRTILFDELVDFDRRDWTVTMICCNKIEAESFSTRLTNAYRRLAMP